jgi:hypothetical protein
MNALGPPNSGRGALRPASTRAPIQAGTRAEADRQVSLRLVKAIEDSRAGCAWLPATTAQESGSLRFPAPLGSEWLHCTPQAGLAAPPAPPCRRSADVRQSGSFRSPVPLGSELSTALRRPARCAPGPPLCSRSAVRFAPLPAPPVRLVASCVSVNRNAWVAPKGATDRQPTGRPASLQEAGVTDQTQPGWLARSRLAANAGPLLLRRRSTLPARRGIEPTPAPARSPAARTRFASAAQRAWRPRLLATSAPQHVLRSPDERARLPIRPRFRRSRQRTARFAPYAGLCVESLSCATAARLRAPAWPSAMKSTFSAASATSKRCAMR